MSRLWTVLVGNGVQATGDLIRGPGVVQAFCTNKRPEFGGKTGLLGLNCARHFQDAIQSARGMPFRS